MTDRALLSPPTEPPLAGAPPAVPPRWLRRLSVAATVTTFVLIGVGAAVRATGSGLGCTGWPKCSATSFFPPLRYHALVEYSHRMTAFLDVVLVALVAVVAWRRFRTVPRVLGPALAAVVLVIFQAILGGIVVHGDLAALLVTAHLGTAMAFAGVQVAVTVAAFSFDRPLRDRDGVARLAWAAAGATYVLIGLGAYVRGQGAGLAFLDWPLVNGRLLPDFGVEIQVVHFLHRAFAVLVAALLVALVVRVLRDRPWPHPAAVLAVVGAGLFVLQVLVGAAQVWTRLAEAPVIAHVALAGLVWGSLVAVALCVRLPARAGALA